MCVCIAYRWVNGKICNLDPFTDDYYADPAKCQKPIPDRVNNVYIYIYIYIVCVCVCVYTHTHTYTPNSISATAKSAYICSRMLTSHFVSTYADVC